MGFDSEKMAAHYPPGFPRSLNDLTAEVIGAAMEIHTALGPGLREKIYEAALVVELQRRGKHVARQQSFHVLYKGEDLGVQIVDLVVESQVIVECKSVVTVHDIDHAQALGYLRFTGLPIGLLLNFNVARLKDGITRKINWPPTPRVAALSITTFPSVPLCSSP